MEAWALGAREGPPPLAYLQRHCLRNRPHLRSELGQVQRMRCSRPLLPLPNNRHSRWDQLRLPCLLRLPTPLKLPQRPIPGVMAQRVQA